MWPSPGIDDPSIADLPGQNLLHGRLLSDIEAPLSILQSIERWVGGYPLSETKYCSLDHPIQYFRYNIVFILSPTMALEMRTLSYTGFPLCK